MAKAVWYNPFSWGAKEPKIMTQTTEDPSKTAVSSRLSEFLTSSIGKGLPSYAGTLTEEFDPDAYSRYKEFLSLNPEEWYRKAVEAPTIKAFKEDLLPVITEGYAGSLRGSGRFREEEAGIGKLTEFLATEREKAKVGIPGAQFEMASRYKAMKDADYLRKYQAWMQTLPEYNPVLDKALTFLQGPTGVDTFAALDPGQKGWLTDAIKIALDLAGMAAIPFVGPAGPGLAAAAAEVTGGMG